MLWRRVVLLAACALSLAPGILAPRAWAEPDPAPERKVSKQIEEERRIGKEAEAEVAKQFKTVTDPAYVDRVQRIGAEIAKVVNEPDINFKFTVLDVPEVNAFSLPNGSIYVNKGLVDVCESDDELAGVIGHEIAHAARHHMWQLIRKQRKFDVATLAAIVVGAAAGVNVGQAAQVSGLVTTGITNAYSQELESESDHYAVEYLMKTRYNPVGVLTFMERLALQEMSSQGTIDYGIFRTHPLSRQRKLALAKQLNEKGITINRREVMKSLQAQPVETRVNGKLAAQVVLGGNFLMTVADSDGVPAMERAAKIAEVLNRTLTSKVNFMSFQVGPSGRTVEALGTVLYEVTDEDAALLGKPAKTVAESAKESLKKALWREYIPTLLNR